MYRERIVHHGHAHESIDAHSFAKSAHATQLREKILNKIPGLWMAKSGRQVTLTVDDQVGRALFEAFAWSHEENERVLNKAAKIVRKDLLLIYEIFDGDVSEKRQSRSVPNSLVKLISMILEGGVGEQLCQHMWSFYNSSFAKLSEEPSKCKSSSKKPILNMSNK